MNQLNEKEVETHITILGWLHIFGNAMLLVIGVMGFLFLTGIGVVSEDPMAVRVLSLIGTIGALFFGVVALPGLVAGIGLLARKPWARILALVMGFLGLINFPVGTAIGVYTFWVLFQVDAPDRFAPPKHA